MALRARDVSRAFEKRPPGPEYLWEGKSSHQGGRKIILVAQCYENQTFFSHNQAKHPLIIVLTVYLKFEISSLQKVQKELRAPLKLEKLKVTLGFFVVKN